MSANARKASYPCAYCGITPDAPWPSLTYAECRECARQRIEKETAPGPLRRAWLWLLGDN